MISRITLHSGSLAYSALVCGEGPLVVCLHGFPDNARSYRHQLTALANAGYRAVSITLRGYEPSSQPANRDYTLASIAADIPILLDGLGAEKAHLVGHDWGAAIAYTAGASAPDRFKSLTTMSVPHSGRFLAEAIKHPKQLRMSWYMGFFKLGGISDYIVSRQNYRFIRRLWATWSPGWEIPEEDLQSVIATFEAPGVKEAALSYYRQTLSLGALTPSSMKASKFKVPVPTMALTGETDGCIDTDVFQSMMHDEDFPAGLMVKQIKGAGHFPHQEQPAEVNALLLNWLDRWED